MSRIRGLSHKLTRRQSFATGLAVVGVVMAASIVGIATRAAGVTVPLQTENGTLSGNVASVNLASASGGKAIQFGAIETLYSINDGTMGTGLDQFNFVGTWSYGTDIPALANDYHTTGTAGAYYTVQFNSSQVKIFTTVSGNNGIMAVSIDGGTETLVDTYSASRQQQVLKYTSPTLNEGTHTLKVRYTGTKNASAGWYNIEADRVEITGVRSTPPEPAAAVDASTLDNKYMLGYQAWFRCPYDGSGSTTFNHWKVGSNINVDQWPDTSQLAPADKCDSGFDLPNGSPAYVYSDYNANVQDMKMRWLKEYGIDGTMVQRFTSGAPYTDTSRSNNVVAKYIQAASEKYGRTFNIMWDITGTTNGAPTRAGCSTRLVCILQDDWKIGIVDNLKLTASNRYVKDGGKPVIVIWGFGFGGRPGTPAELIELVHWLQNNPNGPQYNATVMCGVPYDWKTSAYAAAFRECDITSRWSVSDGRLTSNTDTTTMDGWAQTWTYQDALYAKQHGIKYMPTLWPGMSDANRDFAEGGVTGSTDFNLIPRRGGFQIWQTAYNNLKQLKAAGVPTMLFGAMYDEFNEGTAMHHMTTGPATSPNGANLIYTNFDGYTQLPSDHYMAVNREIGRMLRGEIPMTSAMPSNIAPQ
ncbi:MAG: xylosidase/arabinosidase [Candidatus Saccharibacteria bacterium]|nr:xylosidase/arabinosidase [Candidatus Saccharibacteria bacterium]